MELLQNLQFTEVISFTLVLLCLINFVIRKPSSSPTKSTDKKLPPGPWKLPIIGSIHHLAGSALPQYTLRNLSRRYGPLMHLQLGQVPTVVISSPKMAEEVMKRQDLAFASRPEILMSKIMLYDNQDVIFARYGDFWRQMRKICVTEFLSAQNLRSIDSIREDEVAKLLESINLSQGLPINFTEKIYSMATALTSRATVGKICKSEQDGLVRALLQTTHLGGGFNLCDFFPSFKLLHLVSGMEAKLRDLQVGLDTIMQRIIKEHEQNYGTCSGGRERGESGAEDLVHILLRHQKINDLRCPITNHHINAFITDIFAAGTETSSTVTEWAMSEMMRNPKVMEKAQKEVRAVAKEKGAITQNDIQGLKYLKMVIKETLRMHPPDPFLVPRESREDCKIDGYDIPVKTKVIVNAWAIGRDPEYWDDADSFLPERFEDSSVDVMGNDFQLIPFGAGRRMCPGIPFGIPNVEFPIAQLLYHFNWKLPDGIKPEELDMTERFGLTAGRENDLFLVATPYDPFT